MFQMMNEARIGVGLGPSRSVHRLPQGVELRAGAPQGRPWAAGPSTPQVPIIEHADVRRMLLAQKPTSKAASRCDSTAPGCDDAGRSDDGASESASCCSTC